MLRKGPFCKSLLDLPLLPSRHVLGIALLQRSDVFALSSAADALKQLGLEASSLAGAFVIVSEAGGLCQRKLGACANGDASTIVVDYDGKSNVALAVESVLDRDLTEQQWRQVEADYCSRLLAGHAEPVTLRQVAGAFARLARLHRCWLLLRNAAAQAPAPTTPAGGGPVSAWQGGAMPPAAGASVPTPTQMPHVLDEAQREQLLQALERPAFNDCKLLDWLSRVAPWDEGLAMELASSSLQPPLGPQLPADAAAAGPQERQEEQPQKHPLIDQDSMKQQQDRRQQDRQQPAWPVAADECADPRLARRLAPRAAAEAGTAAVAVEALPGEGQRELAAGQKVEAQEAEGWTATGQQRTQGRKEAEGQKAGSDVQHPQHLLLGSMAADAPPADLMPQRPAGPHGTPLAPPLSAAAARARARGAALSGAAAMPDTLGTAGGDLLASGVGPQQQQQQQQQQEDRHRRHGRRSPPASYAAGQQDGLASTAGGQQLTTGWSASGPSAVAAAVRQPHTAVLDPPPSRRSEQKRSRECAAEARHDDGSHRSHRRRSRSPAGRGGRGRNGSPSRSQSRSRSRSRSHSPLRSPSGSRPPSRSRSRSRSPSPALEHARAHAHAPPSPSPGEGEQPWKVRAEELAWARQLHVWLLRQPNRTAVLPLILRSKMGVPGRLLSITGRNPYSFWKAHPALWELLPGAPPSLRARPAAAAAAAAAAHAREHTAAPAAAGGGGRWPPEAGLEPTATLPVPVAAGEGRPPSAMLAAAQMEVAYIRRLYTLCVTDHPKGIPVRNFTRYGVEVPDAVLRGRRMTAFLKSYEDAGVLELNRGTSLPVVVRAVAGPRAEAALQEVCQRLLKQHGRL